MSSKKERNRSKRCEFIDIICCVFCKPDLRCEKCIANNITEEMYKNNRLVDFLRRSDGGKL